MSRASPNPGNEKRVVWITGAAGGLGRALTAAFAAAGWRVAAAGHSALPEVPEGSSGEVWPGRMDVTRAAEVEAFGEGILGRWGRLDVLVNNAGVNSERLVAQTDEAAWDRVMGVNLKGAFLCSRTALGPMRARREGLLLNVASFAARSGPVGQAAYAASKAGLIGLTLSLAREVGGEGIRVNAVLPGVLPTGMTASLAAGVGKGLAAAGVLGRWNRLEEVARQFVELASAVDVSGQVVALDGRVARWT